MRILAVSYFLPPALFPQAIQVGRLINYLHADIGVVCGNPAPHNRGLDTVPYFDARLAFRLNVKFRPLFSGIAARFARQFVPFYARIPDDCRGWIPLAEKALLEKLRSANFQPDIILTFGEPMSDHVLGLRLKQRFGSPWIAHFSDPWVDNSFRRRNILANFVNRRLERTVIANADCVIFTSRETVDLVMRKYPARWREKCAVVPHSFDPGLYPRRAEVEPNLVVRHLGNFYGHRTPLPLFQALRMMLSADPHVLRTVRFDLVGQMPARFRRNSALRALPEGLVRLVDTVPYSESLKLMSSTDLLLTIDGPDDVSVFLPSKLIDYLGSGVPICGIVPPGTSASLLRRLGAPVADPRDPRAIAEALMQSLRLARERRASSVRRLWGEQEVRQEFDVGRVSAAFSSIINRMVPQVEAVGS